MVQTSWVATIIQRGGLYRNACLGWPAAPRSLLVQCCSYLEHKNASFAPCPDPKSTVFICSIQHATLQLGVTNRDGAMTAASCSSAFVVFRLSVSIDEETL
jgi:hypothetical protein